MMNLTGKSLPSLLLVGALSLGLAACSEKDDDTGGDGGTGDGGSDGGSDGGTETDGGTPDGGTSDGGSDTGIMLGGYYGEATVTGAGWDGFEDAYYIGLAPGGAIDCAISSDTKGNSLDVAACAACDWAFSVTTSNSSLSANTGCDLIGLDASIVGKYDGAVYNYGYQSDYYISGYGEYGVLQYYFSGYGWYAVALADYSGDQFMYDWPSGYYYYYL